MAQWIIDYILGKKNWTEKYDSRWFFPPGWAAKAGAKFCPPNEPKGIPYIKQIRIFPNLYKFSLIFSSKINFWGGVKLIFLLTKNVF
jgi:hypothetical protein